MVTQMFQEAIEPDLTSYISKRVCLATTRLGITSGPLAHRVKKAPTQWFTAVGACSCSKRSFGLVTGGQLPCMVFASGSQQIEVAEHRNMNKRVL